MSKTFSTSAWVTLVNVPLVKTSQMANLDSRSWRNKLYLLWEALQHQISWVRMQRREESDHVDGLPQGSWIFFNVAFKGEKKTSLFNVNLLSNETNERILFPGISYAKQPCHLKNLKSLWISFTTLLPCTTVLTWKEGIWRGEKQK